jgi:DNA-binding transcriptional LysR family regulator
VTANRYAVAGHVLVERRGLRNESVAEAVRVAGLEQRVVTVVNGFATALALVRDTELVATVPERHTAGLRGGSRSLPLPFAVPGFMVSMIWHPRMDGDLAHRWLRSCVRKVCAGRGGKSEAT